MSFGIRIGDRSQQFKLLGQLALLNREQRKIEQQQATGRRDGPASYLVIANKLRFTRNGIAVAQDNVADGLEVIGATETQLRTVIEQLGQARELALRGAHGKLSPEEREQILRETKALLKATDETLQRANFNEIPLFEGRRLSLALGPDARGDDLYSLRLPKVDLRKFGLVDGDTCGGSHPQPAPSSCGNSEPPSCNPAPSGGGKPKPTPAPPAPPNCTPQPTPSSSGCGSDWNNSPAVLWVQNQATNWRDAIRNPAVPSSTPSTGTVPQESAACGTAAQAQGAAPCSARTTSKESETRSCSSAPAAETHSEALDRLRSRIDQALKVLPRHLLRLSGDRAFLEARQGLLEDQYARYESMRSRFEDADYAALQLQSAENDFYRQASLNAIASTQTNQQMIVAAFLGGLR